MKYRKKLFALAILVGLGTLGPARALALDTSQTYDVFIPDTQGRTDVGTWTVSLDAVNPPDMCNYHVTWSNLNAGTSQVADLFIGEATQPGFEDCAVNSSTFLSTVVFLNPSFVSQGFDTSQTKQTVSNLACGEDEVAETLTGSFRFDSGTPHPLLVEAAKEFGPAEAWVGLANSDDIGLRLDLLAEVLIDGQVVTSGEVDDVPTGGIGFSSALLHAIPLADVDVAVSGTTVLGYRLSARRTCSGTGHNSGKARLWYNGARVDAGTSRDAGTRVETTIQGRRASSYARTGNVLSANAGTARTFKDVAVNSAQACPARPFTSFGVWSGPLP